MSNELRFGYCKFCWSYYEADFFLNFNFIEIIFILAMGMDNGIAFGCLFFYGNLVSFNSWLQLCRTVNESEVIEVMVRSFGKLKMIYLNLIAYFITSLANKSEKPPKLNKNIKQKTNQQKVFRTKRTLRLYRMISSKP